MHTSIVALVAQYGYTFLFLLVAVESFGIPLPGETALVTAEATTESSRKVNGDRAHPAVVS